VDKTEVDYLEESHRTGDKTGRKERVAEEIRA
jgi:hypothetical protein